MGPHDGGAEHLHQVSGPAQRRHGLEERFEHAGPTQPLEPLPDRVPIAETGGQCPPSDVVDCEIVQRLEEPAVVAALGTSPGTRGGKHPQHRRPVVVRHSRQHGRVS